MNAVASTRLAAASRSSLTRSLKGASIMRGVKKENLPSKICVTCERPFTWRKKWEKVWDEVSTCSKSCNKSRREKMRTRKGNREVVEANDSQRKTGGNDDMINIMSDQPRFAVDQSQEAITGINSTLCEFHEDFVDDCKQESTKSIVADENARRKTERKAAKKAKKAARRAELEGRGDLSVGQKQCDRCNASVDLLIRCLYTESNGGWHLICGKCWKHASGGVVDGDTDHPDYKYGGLWKNRRKQTAGITSHTVQTEIKSTVF